MRLLALDPGAKRMGWAVFDTSRYEASGVFGVEQEKLTYQNYRLKIVEEFTIWMHRMVLARNPDILVSETLPSRGFNNMAQAILAHTALTCCQSIAFDLSQTRQVSQIAAATVKTHIGGKVKATKVQVRNGVLQLIPELADKKSQWTKVFDESDAIAVGLTYLGYDIRTLVV